MKLIVAAILIVLAFGRRRPETAMPVTQWTEQRVAVNQLTRSQVTCGVTVDPPQWVGGQFCLTYHWPAADSNLVVFAEVSPDMKTWQRVVAETFMTDSFGTNHACCSLVTAYVRVRIFRP